jgi:HK97 gp10 family phage protein
MAFAIRAEITGIKELMQSLEKFTPAVQRKILRPALRAEGTRVLKEARAKVPVDTKLLKKSLGQRTKTYKNGRVVVIVGPRHGFKQVIKGVAKNPVRYAHLVEYGAKPHSISARSVIATRKMVAGKLHPGFPGRLVLTRAYKTALNGAAERMAARMAQEIEKLAAKGKLKVS